MSPADILYGHSLRMATTPSKRLVFVDALRGLAAVAVAAFHFYGAGRWQRPSIRTGAFAYHLFSNGDLGVFLFFVLSSFSSRAACITRASTARLWENFLRRSLRLDPTCFGR